MADPYKTLGAGPQFSDEELRQCYIRKIRENPPEQNPERFEEIRGAYDRVKDVRARLSYLLFDAPRRETFEELIQEIEARERKEKWTLAKIRRLFIQG